MSRVPSSGEAGLPEDLRALDAELSSIRYEERASFAPELGAELARAWREGAGHSHTAVRYLVAAVLAAFLVGVAAVPAARASFDHLLGVLTSEPTPPEPAEERAPDPVPAAESEPEAQPEPVAETPEPVEPEVSLAAAADFAGVTHPRMLDRERAQRLLREIYPPELQRAGVGGTVRLRLWVDPVGAVDFVTVDEGSGEPALDQAALRVGRSLRFEPGSRGGATVGTWVEFPVVFEPEPLPEETHEGVLLETGGEPWEDAWTADEPAAPLDVSRIPPWRGGTGIPGGPGAEVADALTRALEGTDAVGRLGPIESLLDGAPPPGRGPTQWRTEAAAALEAAMLRHPDNPAPALALARIRLDQGLRTEARVLVEEALRNGLNAGARVPRALVAELHYERGLLMEESWLSSRSAGRVRGDAFEASACPQARSSGGALTGYASVERLVAWNYSCPEPFQRVVETGFEEHDELRDADQALMAASYRAAIEADAAHPGANVRMLVALADEARWNDVLGAARAFVRATGGHPYGLLYAGLALQRLKKPEAAEAHIELGLRGLSEAEVDRIRDVSMLLDPAERARYAMSSGTERRQWERRFWSGRDPILSTPVNERELEHLVRAVHARLRFGVQGGDAREVWIRYGRPDRVRAIVEGSGRRTEFWDYGTGPDVTFFRFGHGARMDLTPEGRAYVDDLREVFPDRYGPWARTLLSLPVQMARFGPLEGVWSEVEAHTLVPRSFATGPADSLEASLFLLNEQGQPVASVVKHVPAEAGPVSLDAPLTEGAATMVVELLNRATGQVAGAREEVGAPGGDGAVVSDLLLLRPEPPRGEPLTERVRWMTPYAGTARVDDDAVDVFFELYGVGPGEYRLRAEAVDRDTGEVRALPLRPAGERRFADVWRRTTEAETVRAELVRADLSAVPRGRYTLRVFVETLLDGRTTAAERDLGRR